MPKLFCIAARHEITEGLDAIRETLRQAGVNMSRSQLVRFAIANTFGVEVEDVPAVEELAEFVEVVDDQLGK